MQKTKPKYFKFQSGKNILSDTAIATGSRFLQGIQHASKSQRFSGNMAKIAEPYPGNKATLDIVKKFRWTKSSKDSVTVSNTPTITLREMEVINPAFFNNLALLLDQLSNPEGSGVLDVISQFPGIIGDNNPHLKARADAGMDINPRVQDGWLTSPWENIKQWMVDFAGENIQWLADEGIPGVAALTGDMDAIKLHLIGADLASFPAYLRSYERIYGINYTNFTYKLPYLEDSYKQINNSWGGESPGGRIGKYSDTLTKFTSIASPSVGVDFAKTFDYPQAGPSYDINFFLDNTLYDNESYAVAHFTFIYLLLYQNLPNRVNRTSLTPPVIYQAYLEGVFSYRWSFLSKINVNFIGVRRPFYTNIGGEMTKAIIPEGYEVQLTLTSLTPETKNLFYDSLHGAVNVSIKEHKPAEMEHPREAPQTRSESKAAQTLESLGKGKGGDIDK
jgi:hypothetical protein